MTCGSCKHFNTQVGFSIFVGFCSAPIPKCASANRKEGTMMYSDEGANCASFIQVSEVDDETPAS